MRILTLRIQKIVQKKKKQLDLPAPKTDSRELLLQTAGAINETVFGCISVQTASMVITGTGGIHIAARVAKAVAHALTINLLRSTHTSRNYHFLFECISQSNTFCSSTVQPLHSIRYKCL